jgi:hypothetical protein
MTAVDGSMNVVSGKFVCSFCRLIRKTKEISPLEFSKCVLK